MAYSQILVFHTETDPIFVCGGLWLAQVLKLITVAAQLQNEFST